MRGDFPVPVAHFGPGGAGRLARYHGGAPDGCQAGPVVAWQAACRKPSPLLP